jgi:hypothetical protein
MIIEKFNTRKHNNYKIKIAIDTKEAKILLKVLKAARFPAEAGSVKPLMMTQNLITELNNILKIKENIGTNFLAGIGSPPSDFD